MQDIDFFSSFAYFYFLVKINKVQWLLREMHRIISLSLSLSRSWIPKDLFILSLYLCFSTPIVMLSESLFSIPSSSFLPLFFFLLREQRRVRNANGRTATLWVLLKGKVTIENMLSALNNTHYKSNVKTKRSRADTTVCKLINYNILVYQ